MARKSIGPRLYYRKPRKRQNSEEPGVWVIRDGARFISTRCAEHERAKAEIALSDYLDNRLTAPTIYIYFLTARAEGFPIKIGVSRDCSVRTASLQTALPYDVEIMAVMPTDDPLLERRIHRQYRHLRLRGEWFARAPDLEGFIQQLCDEGTAV